MTTSDAPVRYRKLTVGRSVLLALADRQMHGPPERDDFPFGARRQNRCDDCGLTVSPGDLIVQARRPGLQPVLYVHETCPGDDALFRQIEWLRRWEGADIISAWTQARVTRRCGSCERDMFVGDWIALVRRPGPMRGGGEKHSDWKCERCVKL